MGRPSSFTQEIADLICERLADGESLRSICSGENMPSRTTVFRWLPENQTFRDQYARAREAQADLLADEILEIADDSAGDKIKLHGIEVLNSEYVQRSRLRIDARKWIASKLAPKKYGDKLELAGDKESPLTVVIQKLTGDA